MAEIKHTQTSYQVPMQDEEQHVSAFHQMLDKEEWLAACKSHTEVAENWMRNVRIIVGRAWESTTQYCAQFCICRNVVRLESVKYEQKERHYRIVYSMSDEQYPCDMGASNWLDKGNGRKWNYLISIVSNLRRQYVYSPIVSLDKRHAAIYPTRVESLRNTTE